MYTNPTDTDWQRGLVFDHIHIGDVLQDQSDRHGGLVAYRKAPAINEVLTARPGQHSLATRTYDWLHEVERGDQ